MFEFDETFSDISSSSSTATLNFIELLDPEEFQLLSRSFSLEALPAITDEDLPPFDDVPPFPPTRRFFRKTPTNDYSLKVPRRAIILDSCENTEKTTTKTMSITPRMVNVLTEPRVVNTNPGNQTMNFELYEHLAWEEREHVETEPYHGGRGSVAPETSTKKRRVSERSSSSRKGLVSEDEVMSGADENARRWSVQVPKTMNQEMVDMMAELHDLNFFFKTGLGVLEQNATALEKGDNRPEPPFLMLSNSHCAIPISLESSENIEPGPPFPLATRRGKDLPSPITTRTFKHGTEYPSIPTAFLGSPSTYSPKFEYANNADSSSLELEDMISNLRYKCASIQSDTQRTPQNEALLAETSNPSDSWTQPFTGNNDTDWAFANSFMRNLDANPPDMSPVKKAQTSELPYRSLPSPTPSTDTPTWTSNMNLGPNIPTCPGVNRSPPRGPPPATPPPPIPTPSSLSSPHQVRGILKNSKNVRFASLPDKGHKPVKIAEIPLSRPRQSVALIPVDRPSRLRPKSHTITSYTPPLVLPQAHGTPPPSNQDAKRGISGGCRPVSVPVSNRSDSSHTRGLISHGQPRTPLTSISRQNVIPAQKPSPASLGRHSLGRAIKLDIKKDTNDTKGRGLSRRWTDENSFRRGSDASQSMPKSRMPVPLRNILTRFK